MATATYIARRKAGLCTRCGGARDQSGKPRMICEECAAKKRAESKLQYRQRKMRTHHPPTGQAMHAIDCIFAGVVAEWSHGGKYTLTRTRARWVFRVGDSRDY